MFTSVNRPHHRVRGGRAIGPEDRARPGRPRSGAVNPPFAGAE